MDLIQLRYQDPATRTFLGSPSLVRLDNGDLLASHDYFGPGCPRNHENEEHLLSIYRSRDDGRSWTNVTHIANAYWSTLFTLNGAVYCLGASQQYGSIVIRRSEDCGNTWSHPKDAQSGLLFRGGPFHEPPNYHCAPVPVLVKNGRLYRAFEDCSPCNWPDGFQSCVVSVDTGADLLDAANWTMSEKLPFDPA
ncbi:MAG: exo-alpha-sialidase, partial [Candidatus Hydrogenedentes bacterium]|nr:exo-alpha-sialidase [Candidatus Hydrogenedentota bacterium]